MDGLELLQAIINGLVYGSVYAIIAQGFYITYITTKTLNFGQGDFVMVGALIGITVFGAVTSSGLGLLLAFLISLITVIAILGAAGWGLEQTAIKPLRGFHSIGWILSTVAVAMIARNVAMLIWGRDVMAAPSPFGKKVIDFGILRMLPHEIFVLISGFAIMGFLYFFLKKSILGKALEAVAFNKDAASLMGINPRLMAGLAFVISGALAGIGGIMVGPLVQPGAFMGVSLGLKAFAAAIIGGIDSPVGIFVGGLLLGVLEGIFAIFSTSLKDAASFVLILAILAFMPNGLFGKSVREKF
ncbi:branched-chain amino acid ABC transporter permease [Aneurinibacillus tyrosinisolvens]|uniref:branched-chain amino acid ABC transporter permease n=1 Tax=Aneurinibacillus tyrosinisolvens TaxID=1443435 RepID=UPI001F1D4B0C|nr:branched-chain amino acid ABC transporter permease [Aneurinibacillus tyrosinisolvens]